MGSHAKERGGLFKEQQDVHSLTVSGAVQKEDGSGFYPKGYEKPCKSEFII